jgi:hypothetical protein
MAQLFARLLPLALATAISPALFAVSLVLLGGKSSPQLRTFAFLLGGTAATLVATIVGLLIGGGAAAAGGSKIDPIIDMIVGVLLLLVGIAGLAMRPAQHGGLLATLDSRSLPRQLAACFAAGLLSIDANPSTVVPLIAAVRLVGRSAPGFEITALALGLVWILVLLPILLPLVIYAVAPHAAARTLAPISVAATKYGRYLGVAICVVLGVVFLHDGLTRLQVGL